MLAIISVSAIKEETFAWDCAEKGQKILRKRRPRGQKENVAAVAVRIKGIIFRKFYERPFSKKIYQ